MATPLKLLKGEREWLAGFLRETTGLSKPHERLKQAVLQKMEVSELNLRKPKRARDPRGVPLELAMGVFNQVLGSRLIPPLPTAFGIRGAMQSRLNATGLSLPDCRRIAEAAGARWRGGIKAESLIRQAEALLTPLPEDNGAPTASTQVTGGPLEMEDT